MASRHFSLRRGLAVALLPSCGRSLCCGCTSLSTRLGPDLKAHGLRVAGACL
ncbi:hypothetical protein PF005_g29492 [Phytophthora fragariae]|uniref:Uncharacterized protein n=1 Tax=Phytophthora fragariae TaxID=53985 RepID=A0A6A3PSN3_9STRA|nr:hypothetical protein PF003_g39453 [Phytophthora fragariae]KAE9064071.1 hypothetical protein PF006_g30787 [Phytophthora fragariae]KAE9165712.1 hypothetical protein PF005_g29492 [Phytophthora fragariae]KAE9268787.1 hypothetical protein PF008_g31035 [Phytophthora fragariae]